MEVSLTLVMCIVAGLTALYYYFTWNFNFWKSKGVLGPKPRPFFGTTKDVLLGKLGLASYLDSVYDEYHDEPVVGVYFMHKPMLVIHDLDFIRDILRKDFSSFADRGLDTDKFDPLSFSLLTLQPDKWRPLRAKLSPAFTSGKLKDMFHLLTQCSDELDKYIEKLDKDSVDMIDLCRKYTTDVIGVCAFGLQIHTLKDENNVFGDMGKRAFRRNFKNAVKDFMLQSCPMIYRVVGALLQDNEMIDFFINLTKDTLDYRRKNNVVRHDFVDLLMAVQNEPQAVGDMEISDEFLAAQLFIFFLGGFETSASTMSAALFELALNPSVQQKLRDEIVETLSHNDGQVSYDNIKSMKYLDCVVKEALRKYPPIPVIIRKSMEPYTFSNKKLTVPKDQLILIPTYSIQRDSKHYLDAEKFIPERFDPDNFENYPEMAYLAFGDGPRNCIGQRFALMQVKAGLVTMIKSYSVEVGEKTNTNYELDQASFFTAPKNGIILNLRNLKS